MPYNTTGYSPKNFGYVSDYLDAFNATEYGNLTKHIAGYRPFNVSDYSVSFNCSASANNEIPVREAYLRWDCRLKRDMNVTPYNLNETWTCSTRYYSNYSMEDLALLKGYESITFKDEPRKKPAMSDYAQLWNYSTHGKIESSPIMIDMPGAGTGRLAVVFGSYDGRVYAVNADGGLIWKTKIGSPVESVAASDIDGDGRLEILTGSFGGNVTCLTDEGKIRCGNAVTVGRTLLDVAQYYP